MAKPTAATELNTLRDAVSAQQQQIQMLRDELARRDAAMQRVQQQVDSLQSVAGRVQAAEACCKDNGDALAALKTNVASIQTTATATANSLQAAEKKITALESPLAIKYKGITITPGGFISANGIFRSKAQNLSNASTFAGMPFSGQPLSHLSELRFNARYSRLSMLAEGKWGGNKVQAYYEMDFEGAAQTANENITNSFTPRVREAWANVDTASGWSFAGGQTWNLLTANRTGVGPRGLMLPAHIDASLVVGFHYAREGTFRVYRTVNLEDKKKLYFAFSLENPQTVCVSSSTACAGTLPAFPLLPGGAQPALTLFGLQGSAGQPSAIAPNGGFAAPVSVNWLPDMAGKVALEPGWGHFELGVIGRFYRVRISDPSVTGVNNAGSNQTTNSAAVSFNAVMPVVAKKVDVVFTSLVGQGIGRFGPGGGSDVTIRPNGSIEPLRGGQFYAGIEGHPTPKLDLYIYYGNEYYGRARYATGGNLAGTVAPTLIPNGIGYGYEGQGLGGCRVEFASAAPTPGSLGCTSSTRDIYEITPGFWYRFYKGPAGTIQYGMFWEYTHRGLWRGRVTTAGDLGAFPAIQNTVLTAFRWYFP